MKKIFLVFVTILLLTAATTRAQNKVAQKPNIIFLLVDDLGYKDVGFMGSKFYETPNIDKLAGEGIIFTSAYAACAVCSPTRASIQTGRYPARIGVTDWIRARFQANSNELTPPPPFEENGDRLLRTPSNPYWMGKDEITIAELLKNSGILPVTLGNGIWGLTIIIPKNKDTTSILQAATWDNQ